MAEKWNAEKHEYEPYTLPLNSVFLGDENDRVACAACGKEMVYGESYGSLEIHNWAGLAYAVCEECHQQEMERKAKYDSRKDA